MKRSWLPRVILCLSLASLTAFSRAAAVEPFLRATDPRTGWLTSLRYAADTHRVEFLRAGQALGEVILRVRNPGASWREVRQSTNGVALSSSIRPQGEALLWEVRVENTGSEALEVGDPALPLPMNWGFQPRQVGTEWNPATRDLPRGAWPVCGEADHGLVAGIESACTVLFDDPLFGLIAFGGEVTRTNDLIGVLPRDGVRQRFHALLDERRLHLSLDHDGFASEQPILVSRTPDRLLFTLESRAPLPHETTLAVEGLPSGEYSVTADTVARRFRADGRRVSRIPFPVAPGQATSVRFIAIPSGAHGGMHDPESAD